MTTLLAFIRRHLVVAYYVLTFAVAWGGLLLVVGGPSGRAQPQSATSRRKRPAKLRPSGG